MVLSHVRDGALRLQANYQANFNFSKCVYMMLHLVGLLR
jgi:hypothetical protein